MQCINQNVSKSCEPSGHFLFSKNSSTREVFSGDSSAGKKSTRKKLTRKKSVEKKPISKSSAEEFLQPKDRPSLRKFYTHQVKKLSVKKKKESSKKINDLIDRMSFIKDKKHIAIYKATDQEPCLFPFYSQYKESICFPVIKEGCLEFYKNPKDQWKKNSFNILEPAIVKKNKIPVKDISVFFIPGSCFDKKGGRLGRGHAYYDKTLAGLKKQNSHNNLNPLKQKPLFIGVAFHVQVHKTPLPLMSHDILMDMLITDKFILFPFHHNKKKEL